MEGRMKQTKPVRDTSTDLAVRSVYIERWPYNSRFTEVRLFLGEALEVKRYLTKVPPGKVFVSLIDSGIIPDSSYCWVNKEGDERYFTDVAGTEIKELEFDDAWVYITRIVESRLQVVRRSDA